MEILIISFDSLQEWNTKNGTDLSHDQLTDKQFREINKTYHQGWGFSSPEEFAASFNEDENDCPVPCEHFIRFFKDEPAVEETPLPAEKPAGVPVAVYVLTDEKSDGKVTQKDIRVFLDGKDARKAFEKAVNKARKTCSLPVKHSDDSSLSMYGDRRSSGYRDVDLRVHSVPFKGVHETKTGRYGMIAVFGEDAMNYADEHGFEAACRKIRKGKLDGDIVPVRFDTEKDYGTALKLISHCCGCQGYFIRRKDL